MIPKIVHTVWIGPNPMPEKEKELFKKNQSVLKDYEFILWDNDSVRKILPNNDKINAFIEYIKEHRKWAFLSDLIKVLALAKFGGWAIDADNEIVASLQPFERMHWVSGFELWEGRLSPITAVWGALPKHRFSLWMLNVYLANSPKNIISLPNTKWISDAFFKAGVVGDNSRQYVEQFDVQLFPSQVFCGPLIPGQTVALHHFSASWV